jgi:hypothetical protein
MIRDEVIITIEVEVDTESSKDDTGAKIPAQVKTTTKASASTSKPSKSKSSKRSKGSRGSKGSKKTKARNTPPTSPLRKSKRIRNAKRKAENP